jgi:lipopolysaccharide biosynthesis glycosyltransferase
MNKISAGGFFRLFADEILPDTVESVVYFDNDIMIQANLNELNAVRNDSYIFQGGHFDEFCSGLLILNLKRFHEFWDYFGQVPLSMIPRMELDDQSMLELVKKHLVENLKQNLVGDLPREWHVHLVPWYQGHAHELRTDLPHFGMLHFNEAERDNKDTWFKNGIWWFCEEGKGLGNTEYLEMCRQTWMLAEPYVHMPWSMALYLGRSQARRGAPAKIHIETRCPANEETCELASYS